MPWECHPRRATWLAPVARKENERDPLATTYIMLGNQHWGIPHSQAGGDDLPYKKDAGAARRQVSGTTEGTPVQPGQFAVSVRIRIGGRGPPYRET